MNEPNRASAAFSKKIRRQQRRIRCFEKSVAKLQSSSRNFSWLRLGVFLGGIGLTFLLFWIARPVSGWMLLLTIVAFNIVAWLHRRLEKRLERHQLWLAIQQQHLARLKLDWPNLPAAKTPAPDPLHPFDIDLNITGKHSLHQLINVAVSEDGSERLRQWLLQETPKQEDIEKRRPLVAELMHLPGFVDRLRLAFLSAGEHGLDGSTVQHWLEDIKSQKQLTGRLLVAAAFCAFNIAAVIGHSMEWLPLLWPYGVGAYLFYVATNKMVWGSLGEDAEFLDMEFKQSISVFRFLERTRYRPDSALAEFCRTFRNPQTRPSHRLHVLTSVAVAVSLRMNYITWILLNIFLPWDFVCAWMLNRQKQRLQQDFPQWLDVCYDLEALSSLATVARINDETVLPQITFSGEADPPFTARCLGHPLIAVPQRICNDFEFRQVGEVVLITGSNMSGKSTFLRTLGINLVLAFAGAPVVSSAFSAQAMRPFACIQITDSLSSGLSQFYAEVKRLKSLQDALLAEHRMPLFFMIDEIYKGTNNRERLIGGQSYIRRLAGNHGVGAVTTHDLELTHLEKEIKLFRNVHFREHLEGEKLAFDYKLRSGPCPTTNALKIMEMEGLPVDHPRQEEN